MPWAVTLPAVHIQLGQNYPNPFSGVTTIPLPAGSSVVTIFDAAGRRVRVLTGRESVQWDGKAEGGAPAKSGAYFYAVGNGARKMLLVR